MLYCQSKCSPPYAILCFDLVRSVVTFLSSCFRIEVLCEQNRKRDKTSKLLAGLKGKKNKEYLPAQFQDRNLELLNTIRTQMEASFFCSYWACGLCLNSNSQSFIYCLSTCSHVSDSLHKHIKFEYPQVFII